MNGDAEHPAVKRHCMAIKSTRRWDARSNMHARARPCACRSVHVKKTLRGRRPIASTEHYTTA